MTELIDTISQNIMTAYIAQMRSAFKISTILSEHNTESDVLTGDDIICGLVYRLMIPMSNTEMVESLEEANKIMESDGSDGSDGSDEEYDEIEEKYDKPLVSRKIKANNNCDICSKVRVCLINFSEYEPRSVSSKI